jgi:hypothetical protein
MPLERHLQQTVLNHLKKLRQVDPTLVYRKRHGSGMGISGDPDIHGVWKGTAFEIELKRPGEEPTELQRARLEEWGRAGAVTAVIHSANELAALLRWMASDRLGTPPPGVASPQVSH